MKISMATTGAWIKTEEFEVLLGFYILMGINHLPALDGCWSTDPMLHYSPVYLIGLRGITFGRSRVIYTLWIM